MGRHAQTQLAVLGALSVEPMSGYAVRAAITETLGHFWNESFGQIYPALTALEEQGLVRRLNSGRTSGNLFQITPTGLDRLRELLAEPYETAPPRNGLLLRLFFGRHLGDQACRALLQDALDRAEQSLAIYAQILAELDAEPTNPDAKYWRITVEAGVHGATAQSEWARQALAKLAPDPRPSLPPAEDRM